MMSKPESELEPKSNSKRAPKAKSKAKSKSKSKSKSKIKPKLKSNTTRKTGWRTITIRKRKIVSKAQKAKVEDNSGRVNGTGVGDEWLDLKIKGSAR